MYRIYANNSLIFDSTLEDYPLTKGEIEQEVNKAGSFVFATPPTNPFIDQIAKLKTIIRVFKNNELIFRGRVLNFSDSFYKVRTFTCEGELAFLLDSVARPYSFNGSPHDLFKNLIAEHNKQVDEDKQFIVGQITVEDTNDYIARSNSGATQTLDEMTDKLLDSLGGYFYITHNEEGKSVLNWFKDFPYLSRQKIEFGENLLDFVKTDTADDVATALIPYGATIEVDEGTEEQEDAPAEEQIEKRVTIESVNDGKDYVYNQLGVTAFGWIYTSEEWDDVGEPENLKTKAQARIDELAKSKITIELNALDLASMENNIDNFRIGDYIEIISAPHDIDERVLLQKLTRDILDPANDKITLGYEKASFINDSIKNDNLIASTVTNRVTDYVTNQIVQSAVNNLTTLIQQTNDSIMSVVSENQTVNGKTIAEIKSTLTQLNDSFLFEFEQLRTDLGNSQTEYRDEFEIWKKYIRFDNGDIVLGENTSPITLRIENDKIAFYESGVEVAYFKDRNFYVKDGEFFNSLQIGNYAFLPRANGNLSFKKMR